MSVAATHRLSEHATYDVVILGGGLAGLMAASRAEQAGARAVLVNQSVAGPANKLGGFAAFSGAKFSLHPAGTGLESIVGGADALCDLYASLCRHFAASGLTQFAVSDEVVRGEERTLGADLSYRRYHSILLQPSEIERLLLFLEEQLSTTLILRSRAVAIRVNRDDVHAVMLEDGSEIRGRALVVATGRLGADLLAHAGVPESSGKGLDVGIRIEFPATAPLDAMRVQGADAKFLRDGVRTFCLNSPGRIFHYDGLGFLLPGGVVAEPGCSASNIAVLCRLPDRKAALAALSRKGPQTDRPFSFESSGSRLGWDDQSRSILPGNVMERLDQFVAGLIKQRLIDLSGPYIVHYPLFDWHWPVFSQPGTLETGVRGIWAAGDVSGHARGLMQAAAMGHLAGVAAAS